MKGKSFNIFKSDQIAMFIIFCLLSQVFATCEPSHCGCCIDNECVGESECKFLFFSSAVLIILGVAIIIYSSVFVMLALFGYLIQVIRKRKN